MRSLTGASAYRRSATHRSLRAQEADVFLLVNAVLRGATKADDLARTKALADNDRLWTTVMDLMRDPFNALPAPLRAAVISVGFAVKREIVAPEPDFGFLVGINEQIAAGLSGI
jgi:flagellar biosynthesis regulator FlaF